MTHSLNKEASQLLCDAMRCRLEDGDASAENWKDSNGRDMAPGRFWNSGIETTISADDSGPCMGIELNIWERAKVHPFQLKYIYTYYVSSSLYDTIMIFIMELIFIAFCRYDVK
jgi:hypothetical protein